MTIKKFYHIITNNGNEVTEIEPKVPYVVSYQLAPDRGKLLTFNGEPFEGSVETDTLDGWSEMVLESKPEILESSDDDHIHNGDDKEFSGLLTEED